MKEKYIVIVLILFLLTASAAFGQTGGNRLDNGEHAVTIQFGLNTELVMSLGYSYGFAMSGDNNFFNHGEVHGIFKMWMGSPDFKDISFEVGFKPIIAVSDQWSTSLLVTTAVKTTENNLFNGFALASDFGLISGYFDNRSTSKIQWFAANELIYTHTWASHIRTKDVYKEYFYEDVRDGWYVSPAELLRIGMQAGIGSENIDVGMRAGYELFNEFAIFTTPFYALLSTSYKSN